MHARHQLPKQQRLHKKKPNAKKKTSTLKKDATTFVAGKPWIKLFKTIAKDPARSYITGRQTLQGKNKLIVEVSQKRSSCYLNITDIILKKLREENLSKEQAVALREKLCAEHP